VAAKLVLHSVNDDRIDDAPAVFEPPGEAAPLRLPSEEEYLYRGMFANAIWGMFQTTADGRYLNANPALARIYGYPSPAAMLEAVTDIGRQLYVDPGRRDEFMRLMQLKGYVAGFESPVYRRDGSVIWIAETCREVRSSTGAFLYFEGAVEDVTQRKNAEKELLVAKDLAEVASRTKSAFLANMSHELRTPLNAVLGFAEVLQKEIYGPVGDARYRDYVGSIHASARHLLDLINSILDMTKIESGHFEIVEQEIALEPILAGCEQLVGDSAQKRNIRFQVLYPAWPIRLRADPIRLKQILVNLLSNAIKFTPSGQAVVMSAWIRPDGQCVLQVADTGIGMRQEDIAKALEPFQQVDSSLARRYEGTGLGLSLTKSMAEMHGGSLAIDSTPAMGTTVTILLPANRVLEGGSPPACQDEQSVE